MLYLSFAVRNMFTAKVCGWHVEPSALASQCLLWKLSWLTSHSSLSCISKLSNISMFHLSVSTPCIKPCKNTCYLIVCKEQRNLRQLSQAKKIEKSVTGKVQDHSRRKASELQKTKVGSSSLQTIRSQFYLSLFSWSACQKGLFIKRSWVDVVHKTWVPRQREPTESSGGKMFAQDWMPRSHRKPAEWLCAMKGTQRNQHFQCENRIYIANMSHLTFVHSIFGLCVLLSIVTDSRWI